MNHEQISKLSIHIKANSEKHFRIFFEQTHGLVFGVCKKMGLSNEDTEEVIQDAFVQFWKQRQNINKTTTVLGLLKVITKRLVYKKIDAKKEILFLDTMNTITEIEHSTKNQKINEPLLNKYLDKLPKNQKHTMHLFYKAGLDSKEIAEHLNISVRTVENNLYRAKKTLKEWLQNDQITLNDLLLNE